MGVTEGELILDVGCGTGSLTFTLARAANVASVTGIDCALPYVEHVRAANSDRRTTLKQGDAPAMPFEAACFAHAIAVPSLQFMRQPDPVVGEMRRVVRAGGVGAAAACDSYAGMPSNRMFWDIAGMQDPNAIVRRAYVFQFDLTARRTWLALASCRPRGRP